jgi:AraC-like DNA-binding protein
MTAPANQIDAALLDRVLSHLEVFVEPFTYCLLSTGWRLSLPPAPRVMLHFVLLGEGVLRMPGEDAYPLGHHWLAIVPQGVGHALESGRVRREQRIDPPGKEAEPPDKLVAGSSEKVELVVACGMIQARYGQSLDLFEHLPGPLSADLSGHPEIRSAFDTLLQEQSDPGPGSMAMQAALMSQCLVRMLRDLSSEPEVSLPWLAALRHPRLAQALERVFADPGAHHTVDSLADRACMSRSSFARRFAEAFGVPPMSFVQNVRMQKAARLLRNEARPVDSVARQVGYASRSYFSRAFKTKFGVSPMVFREEKEMAASGH